MSQRSAISSVVGTASGQVAEGLLHLGRVLQIELVRVEAQLRLGERRLGLHAQQRGVARVVLAAQVVDVRRADQRAPELARDPRDPLVGAVLLGDLVVLDLEVDVLRAEHAHQVVDVGARVRSRSWMSRWQKRDWRQPVSAITPSEWAVEQLHVDVCLAAPEALQVAGEESLIRFRRPAPSRASSVRWLRS